MDGELTVEVEVRVARVNSLAAQVAEAESRVVAARAQAWQLGVMLGWELLCIKGACGHGAFGKLFKNNSKSDSDVRFDITDRTARRYMALYEDANEWFRKRGTTALTAAKEVDEVPSGLTLEAARRFFREEEPEPTRPAPKFAAPNQSGRVRKGGDEVSEQERIAAQAESATKELETLTRHLREFVESGRHTLVPVAERDAALALFSWVKDKFKIVNRKS